MTDFLSNLGTVALQVLILFFLVGIGFILGKTRILNDTAAKAISTLCLTLATPSVIIKSFIRPFNPEQGAGLILSLCAALLCHLIAILISHSLFRRKNKAVMRASIVLSNAGFMGLPLQAAILGDDGTFFGAAYVIMMTLFLWTYGLSTLSEGKEKLNFKKLIINPAVIAVAVGAPLFLFSFTPPEVITTTVNHIANLNTPLPMIVVGYYLSKTSFLKAFTEYGGMGAILIKLLLVPLACIAILFLLGFRGAILVSNVISVSTPIAVAVTMFTSRFDGNTELSANMVSVSTLFSIITMPIVVALAQTIS